MQLATVGTVARFYETTDPVESVGRAKDRPGNQDAEKSPTVPPTHEWFAVRRKNHCPRWLLVRPAGLEPATDGL